MNTGAIATSEVNVHEAKTHFSKLLRRVAAGEEVVIARAGVPVARLVPVARRSDRVFGIDRGRFQVPEDFDASLPEDVLRDFES
ncbi:MAG: type II toxin-antitoxin system Phd/YefM family antitoxin [Acidobacteriota bacterium]